MRLLRCADSAVLIELADLDEVRTLYDALADDPPVGVTELVPAARTLLLRLTPPDFGRVDRVMEAVRLAWETVRVHGSADRPAGELVEIPVTYDGPDLREVGELTGLTPAEIIAAHTGQDWTVAFCGFAPGFGYLIGGDPRLRVPRRETSRTRVPTGAVGLAGEFSGVYPRESPGGWQLIGRTTVRTFDPDREPAALLRPGVRVRFRDITDAGASE
jgi:KipI family sensor histidine kinase inhibitor